MRRKFLSIALCVCMMFTMVPFAFATDDTTEGSSGGSGVTTPSGGAGGSGGTTLQAQINAIESTGTITLNRAYTEDVTIPANKNITLNLNGQTLTNKTTNTITVDKDATLTVTGAGTVDNITHGKAALYNKGTVILEGGTFERSSEAGTDADHNGGNSYYTILNHGTMTVKSDVTVNNKGHYSSLFENGYFDYTKALDGIENPSLIIEGGKFDGGLNTIKNDDNATLLIKDGTFINYTQAAFQNHHIATINGGTFTAESANAVLNCGVCGATNDEHDKHVTTITGGTFTGAMTCTVGQISISGGTYSVDVSAFCAEGYYSVKDGEKYTVKPLSEVAVAKIGDTLYATLPAAVEAANSNDTITLLSDVTLSGMLVIQKDLTLDLNGKTLSRAGSVLDLYNNTTIKNGTINCTYQNSDDPTSTSCAVWVNQTANLTVADDVTFNTSNQAFAVAFDGSCTAATVNFKGIITGGNGITMNGNIKQPNTSNKLIVDGANINVTGHGMYLAGYGTTEFSVKNSTIIGSTGIEVRAGNLTVNNCVVSGNGEFSCVKNDSGTTTNGAGIAIVQHTTKQPINVTISGGDISGTYSVYEENVQKNDKDSIAKVSLSVTNGNFTGPIDSKDLTGFISGGYFTTDPTSYLAANRYTVASNKDGYSYMVTQDAPATAPIIVTDKTEATVNETITDRDKEKINAVSGKTNIDGVAEAIDTNKKSSIVTAAGVDSNILGDSTKKIEVDVNVKVEVTSADLANNAITFTATPEATVKVNGSADNTKTVTIDNSYLNGKEITVKLPLPEQFKAEQIKHTSTDGSVEYFLLTEKRGAKTFTIDENNCAVFTITKFSTFEVSGKQTYVEPSSGGPGSSGGSISTPTTYAVNVNAATNGAVAADKKTASKGTTVTVTASPSKGYVVDAVKVVDKDGKDVAVTEKDGKYVFTMPASAVTVTGSFKAETPAPVALPFTDVKSGNWFYDAVKYAYAQGLMTGTSATTFAPNGTMNRAMIVTVLYRLEKSPAVTGASKFTDVPAGQWYSDAVAWAAANKIVNGYDETTFGPMNAVTREQMAAILFRYEQVKGLENVTLEENLNRFPDQNKISAYAIPALQWAVGQKIINGNADGTLDPTGTATRAQVAQIFTNLLNK